MGGSGKKKGNNGSGSSSRRQEADERRAAIFAHRQAKATARRSASGPLSEDDDAKNSCGNDNGSDDDRGNDFSKVGEGGDGGQDIFYGDAETCDGSFSSLKSISVIDCTNRSDEMIATVMDAEPAKAGTTTLRPLTGGKNDIFIEHLQRPLSSASDSIDEGTGLGKGAGSGDGQERGDDSDVDETTAIATTTTASSTKKKKMPVPKKGSKKDVENKKMLVLFKERAAALPSEPNGWATNAPLTKTCETKTGRCYADPTLFSAPAAGQVMTSYQVGDSSVCYPSSAPFEGKTKTKKKGKEQEGVIGQALQGQVRVGMSSQGNDGIQWESSKGPNQLYPLTSLPGDLHDRLLHFFRAEKIVLEAAAVPRIPSPSPATGPVSRILSKPDSLVVGTVGAVGGGAYVEGTNLVRTIMPPPNSFQSPTSMVAIEKGATKEDTRRSHFPNDCAVATVTTTEVAKVATRTTTTITAEKSMTTSSTCLNIARNTPSSTTTASRFTAITTAAVLSSPVTGASGYASSSTYSSCSSMRSLSNRGLQTRPLSLTPREGRHGAAEINETIGGEESPLRKGHPPTMSSWASMEMTATVAAGIPVANSGISAAPMGIFVSAVGASSSPSKPCLVSPGSFSPNRLDSGTVRRVSFSPERPAVHIIPISYDSDAVMACDGGEGVSSVGESSRAGDKLNGDPRPAVASTCDNVICEGEGENPPPLLGRQKIHSSEDKKSNPWVKEKQEQQEDGEKSGFLWKPSPEKRRSSGHSSSSPSSRLRRRDGDVAESASSSESVTTAAAEKTDRSNLNYSFDLMFASDESGHSSFSSASVAADDTENSRGFELLQRDLRLLFRCAEEAEKEEDAEWSEKNRNERSRTSKDERKEQRIRKKEGKGGERKKENDENDSSYDNENNNGDEKRWKEETFLTVKVVDRPRKEVQPSASEVDNPSDERRNSSCFPLDGFSSPEARRTILELAAENRRRHASRSGSASLNESNECNNEGKIRIHADEQTCQDVSDPHRLLLSLLSPGATEKESRRAPKSRTALEKSAGTPEGQRAIRQTVLDPSAASAPLRSSPLSPSPPPPDAPPCSLCSSPALVSRPTAFQASVRPWILEHTSSRSASPGSANQDPIVARTDPDQKTLPDSSKAQAASDKDSVGKGSGTQADCTNHTNSNHNSSNNDDDNSNNNNNIIKTCEDGARVVLLGQSTPATTATSSPPPSSSLPSTVPSKRVLRRRQRILKLPPFLILNLQRFSAVPLASVTRGGLSALGNGIKAELGSMLASGSGLGGGVGSERRGGRENGAKDKNGANATVVSSDRGLGLVSVERTMRSMDLSLNSEWFTEQKGSTDAAGGNCAVAPTFTSGAGNRNANGGGDLTGAVLTKSSGPHHLNPSFVPFPLILDMKPYLATFEKDLTTEVEATGDDAEKEEKGPLRPESGVFYSLMAVIAHEREEEDDDEAEVTCGGHYVTYVRRRRKASGLDRPLSFLSEKKEEETNAGSLGPRSCCEDGAESDDDDDDVWYHVSDEEVREAIVEEVLTSEAYVLMYGKCERKDV